jgi:hypothetical protein
MKTPNRKNQLASRRGTPCRCGLWGALALAGVAACSSSAPSPPEQAPAPPDPHYVPAAQVAVPPTVAWTPRPVVEPANPILHAAQLHNPGVVNGDRPARPAAGPDAAPARPLVTQDVMPDPPPRAAPAQPDSSDAARFEPGIAARTHRDFHRRWP